MHEAVEGRVVLLDDDAATRARRDAARDARKVMVFRLKFRLSTLDSLSVFIGGAGGWILLLHNKQIGRAHV